MRLRIIVPALALVAATSVAAWAERPRLTPEQRAAKQAEVFAKADANGDGSLSAEEFAALGTIVRDTIVPYATARKIGWTDVDFLGSAAAYDLFVAGAQGGVTEGLYAMGLTDMPYRDALSPPAQACFDRYKERFKADPNMGAVYGHVAADLTVTALEKAGPDLTLDSFIRALESIRGYRDIFNGPEVSFGPDKRQGANSSFLAVVKGGRWVRVTEPLGF